MTTTDTNPTTTAVTLYREAQILTDLVRRQQKASVCDVCAGPIGRVGYTMCRAPDFETHATHQSHTGCETCALDPELGYIGDAGSCKVCFNLLGCRRSSVHKAGVALRPPVLNTTLNRVNEGYSHAQKSIETLNEADDAARRQVGVDRRNEAVADVRRRREEEMKCEAEQARQDAERLRQQAETERHLRETVQAEQTKLQEKMRRDETERREAEKKAKDDAERLQRQADEERQLRETAQAEQTKLQEKMRKEEKERLAAEKRAQKVQKKLQDELAAEKSRPRDAATAAPAKRTKRKMTEKAHASFCAKRAATAQLKKDAAKATLEKIKDQEERIDQLMRVINNICVNLPLWITHHWVVPSEQIERLANNLRTWSEGVLDDVVDEEDGEEGDGEEGDGEGDGEEDDEHKERDGEIHAVEVGQGAAEDGEDVPASSRGLHFP